MPDIITHYLFGLDTSNAIKKAPLYTIIKAHRGLFFIGLQGPDPIYYHQLQKKNTHHTLASRMHTEKTQDFLLNCISFTKKHVETPEIFEPCIAYVSGLICHYVLDRLAHPYIFYLGGRFLEDHPESFQYKGLHKHIELAIDTLLLEQKFNLKANSFKVHKHILKEKNIPEAILLLYNEVLFATYAVPHGDKIFKEAYKDFRHYFKLTYDRIGIKKATTTLASPFMPSKLSPFLKFFSYYNCTHEFIDYLNKGKKVWLHPVTGNVYTFSFHDILHNALKQSSNLLLSVYAFTQSELSYEELLELLPDVSYLTNLPTSDSRPMIYFSDLWTQF